MLAFFFTSLLLVCFYMSLESTLFPARVRSNFAVFQVYQKLNKYSRCKKNSQHRSCLDVCWHLEAPKQTRTFELGTARAPQFKNHLKVACWMHFGSASYTRSGPPFGIGEDPLNHLGTGTISKASKTGKKGTVFMRLWLAVRSLQNTRFKNKRPRCFKDWMKVQTGKSSFSLPPKILPGTEQCAMADPCTNRYGRQKTLSLYFKTEQTNEWNRWGRAISGKIKIDTMFEKWKKARRKLRRIHSKLYFGQGSPKTAYFC